MPMSYFADGENGSSVEFRKLEQVLHAPSCRRLEANVRPSPIDAGLIVTDVQTAELRENCLGGWVETEPAARLEPGAPRRDLTGHAATGMPAVISHVKFPTAVI